MDDDYDLIDPYWIHGEPVSHLEPQYVEAGWCDMMQRCDKSSHPEYNEGFIAGYEAGLSDGYNGRSYGLSYDNGEAFFKYSFREWKDFGNTYMSDLYEFVTIMVNRNNVSNVYSFYGDTYYEFGFATIKFYDLLPFDEPQKDDIGIWDKEYMSEDDDFGGDFDGFDDMNEPFGDSDACIVDDSDVTSEDSFDYRQCGYDDGYKEGFYYGHQRFLDILNDEI